VSKDNGSQHKTPIFRRSHDTDVLVNMLSKLDPGDVITYDELSKVIGRDVREGTARGALLSARRVLLKEQQKLIEVCERGVSLKCCVPQDVVQTLASRRHHEKRHIRKSVAISCSISKEQYEGLSPEMRTNLNLERTFCALQCSMHETKQVEALRAKCESASNPPALAVSFNLLKENL